ncbi:hypothetical protein V8C86DRAFT_2916037 [Haematococcus lacustris]
MILAPALLRAGRAWLRVSQLSSCQFRGFSAHSDPSPVESVQDQLDEFRASCREFAKREIAPLASGIDRDNEMPGHLWRAMGEFGLLGITAPQV